MEAKMQATPEQRRGRSPLQPSQKRNGELSSSLKRSYEVINPPITDPTYFDDDAKRTLNDQFLNERFSKYAERDKGKIEGVRVYDKMQKNASSAHAYNLISNLTNEQMQQSLAYDGITPEYVIKQQVS